MTISVQIIKIVTIAVRMVIKLPDYSCAALLCLLQIFCLLQILTFLETLNVCTKQTLKVFVQHAQKYCAWNRSKAGYPRAFARTAIHLRACICHRRAPLDGGSWLTGAKVVAATTDAACSCRCVALVGILPIGWSAPGCRPSRAADVNARESWIACYDC